MVDADPRSDARIAELRAERSSPRWQLIRRIHRRRPLLTALVVLAALGTAWFDGSEPGSLVDATAGRFWIGWILILLGVTVRIWGSGNLRKNEEITESGVYLLIRHPLYFGSLSIFLAYFLLIGNPFTGLVYFGILVLCVYLPTMLGEEEYLSLKFPRRFAEYRPPPRFLPALWRLPRALRDDQFSFAAALRNLGIRSLWVVLFLPALLEALRYSPRP